MFAYFASVVEGDERGIHGYILETNTGALRPTSITKDRASPMFVTAHPDGRSLYAVFSEKIGDDRKGYVASYSIDRETGNLTEMSRRDSGGGVPCYIGIDRTASYVMVANYFGATTAVFPIQKDGSLAEVTSVVKYGDDREEHDEARLHCAIPSPCNEYVFTADLGNDQVLVYRFNVGSGKLTPHSSVSLPLKAGPRHLVTHLKGPFVYCVNERNSTVTAFKWDEHTGRLTMMQTKSILPDDFQNKNTGSDLRLHPTGKFLYASNRGHDSLAVFSVDHDSGVLTPAGHQPTRGRIPRSFVIDPNGRLALVVNEGTHTAVAFWINEHTGLMDFTGHESHVPKAISVAIVNR